MNGDRLDLFVVDDTGSMEMITLDTSHENAYVLSTWSTQTYNNGWDPVFSIWSGLFSVLNDKTGERAVTMGPSPLPSSFIMFSSDSDPSRLFCESSGTVLYDGRGDLWSLCTVKERLGRILLYNASEVVDDSVSITSCTPVQLKVQPMIN
ncbi:hypothetical protein PNOK_0470000 [Pyrrhoderma noxium]|uniref:Uncharacterized protein n=1 Tax=Pyrrhoderma noxium TaxID=2282107 RepID=A0A286UJG7_9AGAM|nr:hypothetical protein PNOK_0470000 [Pyrrhoderma noxium]